MKKKLIAVLFSFTICTFALTGCTSNQPTTNTNTTESQTTEIPSTQTQDSEDSSSSDAVDITSDEYVAFSDCMNSIYDVQAGAAGASLRAESASESLIKYVGNNSNLDDATVASYIGVWIAEKENDNPTAKNDFLDCLNMAVDVANEMDDTIESNDAFNAFVEVIRTALN